MVGPWQIILIIVVILLLFGAKRIPELMGSLGKGINEFKKAMDGQDKSAQSNKDKVDKQEPGKDSLPKPT